MRYKSLTCAIAMSLGVLIVPPTLADSNNVIVNGTFDDNLTGWVGDAYFAQSGSGFPFLNTQPYFWSGTVPTATISQVYNLDASVLLALS